MNLERLKDDSFIDYIVGENASRGLSELEVQLVLVQSACMMALEGKTRASASEVAARALKEYSVEATASFTGQTFSSLGISSVTTHGKNRLVLDADQLEEIRLDLHGRCEKAVEKLKASVDKFKDLPQRIRELQMSWKLALSQRAEEQELIRLINEDRRNPPRMDYIEAEYRKIQERNERISQIRKEIKSLEQKEKKLPSLEERKKELETKIADHKKAVAAMEQGIASRESKLTAQEKEIATREREADKQEEALSRRLEKLQKRLGWLELASLHEAIDAAKEELDSLSRQLGEKRSLLDILRRKKGGPTS